MTPWTGVSQYTPELVYPTQSISPGGSSSGNTAQVIDLASDIAGNQTPTSSSPAAASSTGAADARIKMMPLIWLECSGVYLSLEYRTRRSQKPS